MSEKRDQPQSSNEVAVGKLRKAGVVALGVAGTTVLLFAAASYPLSSLLIRPRLKRMSQLRSPHLRDLIRRVGIALEEVTIKSFDNTKLYGWWMEAGSDAPTIVILHGVKKNRTDVIRTALVLRKAGFNILVFDGRGHGASEGRYVTYGLLERRDVQAAIQWITATKNIDVTRLGLAGESMGAAIALQVAAENQMVRAVWADSPFASLRRVTEEFIRRVTRLPNLVLNPVLRTTLQVAKYRCNFDIDLVDPLSMAVAIKCPVFIVHGTADQLIDADHSQNIFDALGGRKELWLVEGGRHARAARHVKHQYGNRIVGFFTEHLGAHDESG